MRWLSRLPLRHDRIGRDPRFSLTTAFVLATAVFLPGLSGSAPMRDQLQAITDNLNLSDAYFLNTERVEPFRRALEAAPSSEQVFARVALGRELLRAGSSKEAAVVFGEALDHLLGATETPETPDRQQVKLLRHLLAIAWMRVGEQENCVALHTPESCIFPLSGGGVHRATDGARRAIAEYLNILADHPDDLEARWLLNLAFMTVGEHPDKVPARWLIAMPAAETEPSATDARLLGPRFKNIAQRSGVDVVGLSGGAVMDDMNGDGNLDLVASSWGLRDPLAFYLGDGHGAFADKTPSANLTGIVGGLNIVQADYDNDDDLDLFVLRGGWMQKLGAYPNSLLQNDGHGRFTDVTDGAGLAARRPSQVGVWADFDLDGDLDLFIGNEDTGNERNTSLLYQNRGDGTFEDVTDAVGIRTAGPIKGAAWGDYDNDGKPDLFVSVYDGPNFLWRNLGCRDGAQCRFMDVTERSGVREPKGSFSAWFWDYDNDGWEDLFVAGFYDGHGLHFREMDLFRPDSNERLPDKYWQGSAFEVARDVASNQASESIPRLYRNRGDGTFEDRTMSAGLRHTLLAMGSNFGDIDNDGRSDLYLGTGEPSFRAIVPNRMFRGTPSGRFQDVTTTTGLGHLQKGHGVAFGDMDNDGDQDVYTVLGGWYSGDTFANALFENPGNKNHWATLRLQGTTVNRSAIGARIAVRVTTPSGKRTVHATIGSGSSFGGNSLQAEIGLGDATSIEAVDVTWPGVSVTQRWEGLELDRRYRLTEGKTDATLLP